MALSPRVASYKFSEGHGVSPDDFKAEREAKMETREERIRQIRRVLHKRHVEHREPEYSLLAGAFEVKTTDYGTVSVPDHAMRDEDIERRLFCKTCDRLIVSRLEVHRDAEMNRYCGKECREATMGQEAKAETCRACGGPWHAATGRHFHGASHGFHDVGMLLVCSGCWSGTCGREQVDALVAKIRARDVAVKAGVLGEQAGPCIQCGAAIASERDVHSFNADRPLCRGCFESRFSPAPASSTLQHARVSASGNPLCELCDKECVIESDRMPLPESWGSSASAIVCDGCVGAVNVAGRHRPSECNRLMAERLAAARNKRALALAAGADQTTPPLGGTRTEAVLREIQEWAGSTVECIRCRQRKPTASTQNVGGLGPYCVVCAAVCAVEATQQLHTACKDCGVPAVVSEQFEWCIYCHVRRGGRDNPQHDGGPLDVRIAQAKAGQRYDECDDPQRQPDPHTRAWPSVGDEP